MHKLTLMAVNQAAINSRYLLAEDDEPDLTLGELLREEPAYFLAPVEPAVLDIRVCRLRLTFVDFDAARPVYVPRPSDAAAPIVPSLAPVPAPKAAEDPATVIVAASDGHPAELTDRQAVLIAHDLEITRAAAYLDAGLSVFMRCEKLLGEYLAREIAGRSGRSPKFVEISGDEAGSEALGPAGLGGGRRAELLAVLQRILREAKTGDIIVVPHLDLLAGGSDAALSAEARELTDVLYERSDCTLLAFSDPSLTVPEVLTNRFAIRLGIDILPRAVLTRSGDAVPIGQALVTQAEAAQFAGFAAVALYKHIAGLNAVRLRHALRYALHQHQASTSATFADLLAELRSFKARTSRAFEVPNVSFDSIGGYPDVKQELGRALSIVGGATDLPEHLRHDLVPRGFILHGPPGTGKTLFAKAVASKLNATILVVSGPEVTDMYVGESERKVRELFAEARRNAPAVVVFDEFDSIAGRRSRNDDGGSRAGNAVVAQLLTELDGFRPEVPVLIIGTTNRIDLIDDALLRPSRFKPIRIDLPDESARREIARVHARHFEIPASEDLLGLIARATDKLNGDEIRSLFRDVRADDLVDPGDPASVARRLGRRLGGLRLAQQERQQSAGVRAGRPAGRGAAAAADEATGMVLLTARRRPEIEPVAADQDTDQEQED
jgi:transitional endoplasmic reticulum ATPase